MNSLQMQLPTPPVRLDLLVWALVVIFALVGAAPARTLSGGHITELNEIPRMRPEYPVPSEPNQLFYVQRSVNSNTVVYIANVDARGNIDRRSPVEGFWRWFNVDGQKKPLNLIERMMAYGVHISQPDPKSPVIFSIAALREHKLMLALDDKSRPEALVRIGERTVKLVYIYLHVVEGGLLPKVPSFELFGIDKATGKAVHERVIVGEE